MEKLQTFLLHGCVVCSIVRITAAVLDWYNPFMDFSGHTEPARTFLCIGVLALALLRKEQSKKERRRMRHEKRICYGA